MFGLFSSNWLISRFLFKGLYFDDGAAGGSTGNEPGANGDQGTGGDNSADGADPNAGSGDDKNKGKDEKKFNQADVDAIVKERLERVKKKADEESASARKKAEEAELEKNKKFEELATQRQNDIEGLSKQLEEANSHKERADKYEEALNKMLKVQTDQLPKPIQELLEKQNPIEKMEYLVKHAKELNIKTVTGIPETDQDDDPNKLTNEAKEKAKQSNAKHVKGLFSR